MAVEEEALERDSQKDCPVHGRSYCSRPQPGSLSPHWTDYRSPVMKETDDCIIDYCPYLWQQ